MVEIPKLLFCRAKAHFTANRDFKSQPWEGWSVSGQTEANGHSNRSLHYCQGLEVDNR